MRVCFPHVFPPPHVAFWTHVCFGQVGPHPSVLRSLLSFIPQPCNRRKGALSPISPHLRAPIKTFPSKRTVLGNVPSFRFSALSFCFCTLVPLSGVQEHWFLTLVPALGVREHLLETTLWETTLLRTPERKPPKWASAFNFISLAAPRLSLNSSLVQEPLGMMQGWFGGAKTRRQEGRPEKHNHILRQNATQNDYSWRALRAP